ncbi:SGNH/GDSL hydrolase family protein [Paenibacillus sp. GP183]|uniref:SGNH/GDSL hydrolase family protein n=1 Tax=Paenibacillus sp. GP183 TaxID=1882751 RepID=UPI00089675C2|nr:SGNH/GDSL hydrolase family protein [Paenibacillus sp. GP183]SEC48517.1 Lysophospholipase L1 [Paenibacillus sp. GP183]
MINYIALGDSITFGQKASSSIKAYPTRVTTMLKLKGIQAKRIVIAEPNWTSADLAEEIYIDPSFLGCAKVVTVWIGGNDLIHYGLSSLQEPAKPIQEMMKNFKKRLDLILGLVRLMKVKHIICCTQYNPFPNTVIAVDAIGILNELIIASATTNSCQVARVDQWFSGHEHRLIYGYRGGKAEDALRGFADVHPNDQGHEVIAAGLFSTIYPLIRPR